MRNTIVFCSWTSQIVLQWLHEGCDSDLLADFLHFGANDFPSKNPFKKWFKIVFFFALASRSGFEPAISDPVARSSIVFCNSVFADRIVMAASRLLFATAACVILLSFAARLRKSYWSGCRKAATVICQQISSILALVIFLLKILLKSVSKSSFFRSGVEIGFEPAISDPVARSSIVFCNSVFADRIVMAASRLLGAAAACVILLFFAAGLCKSY